MNRRARWVVLVMLATGCARSEGESRRDAADRARSDASASASARPAAADTAATPGVAPSPIEWQLVGEPSGPVAMSRRTAFRIWLVARNTGSGVVDTHRDRFDFFLNGKPSFGLGTAFGNGIRNPRWSALPPGETVREARDLVDAFFPAPGAFDVELRQRRDGAVVARLHVDVVADGASTP